MHVALIRGINVGKAKRVAMGDLRALIAKLGYGDPRTLLNSGNVVFDAGREAAGKRLQPLARQVWKPEALGLGSRAAYLWCPVGMIDSPLTEAVGRVLGDATTTRNWATVTKIRALL